MKVEELLHMNGGTGNNSYAANSKIQKKTILMTKPLMEVAFLELSGNQDKKMVVVDLGCSSGPNTLLIVSEVSRIIKGHYKGQVKETPKMQFFLNDLHGNDFNNIFRSLLYLEEKLKDEGMDEARHFIAGLPGSFYGRLLPCQTVHFFHSSYSLMWISQVPQGLDGKKNLNKGNIYISKTSPPQVVKLYQEQFQKDFALFLKLRFTELVSNRQMVLAFLGRKNKEVLCGELSYLWNSLADALNSKGRVDEEKLASFNLPFYTPSVEEIETIVIKQGQFNLLKIKLFESNWDLEEDDSEDDLVVDNMRSGKNVALSIRAVLEPMIASHFGQSIIEDLFSRFATNIAKHLLKEKTKFPVLVFSLKKKDLI